MIFEKSARYFIINYFWYIFYQGETFIRALDGCLDGPMFENILKNHLIPWIEARVVDDLYPWFIVLDNAPGHDNATIRAYAENNLADRLHFLSPKSPDLNIIEKCFGCVKPRLRQLGPRPRNREEIILRFYLGWNTFISPQLITKMYDKFYKRPLAVIEAGGEHTKYW